MDKRKPTVVVSSCLTGENVRYNGKVIKNQFVEKLKNYVNLISVCPEVSIGLPTPRDKIVLVRENKSYKVYQPSTGIDFTQKLTDFSFKFLESLKDVDGFLLKSKSPSCGVSGTKCYKNKDGSGFIGRRRGIFAIETKKLFQNYPVEDELKLEDFLIKFEFLTKVYLIRYFKILDIEEFVEKYGRILNFYNKKRTKIFLKNPSLETLLKIFNVRLTEIRLKKYFKGKKIDFELLKRDNLIIFPDELLK
ncbi:MAG: hypothetical protein DSY59_00470 [Persephonella sp.]|nr:MAG: hypothetical protein DSY59_00470 [Persephonella sp.]